MTETNVFQLSQPGTFTDPLTAVLRNGARALLAQAVEAEAAALLASHADNLTEDGRRRLVRKNHLAVLVDLAIDLLRRGGARRERDAEQQKRKSDGSCHRGSVRRVGRRFARVSLRPVRPLPSLGGEAARRALVRDRGRP